MDILSHIALTFTPGLGNTTIRRLVAQYPDVDLFALGIDRLRTIFPAHSGVAAAIAAKEGFPRAEQELRFCQEHGIRPLFFTDPDYPDRLNAPECADCPALLYVLGRADLRAERTVAVVGTRKATPHGREATEKIVGGLAYLHTPIVSGLAYGIDTAAHTAALDHGLPTLAVLGHGLDRIYPPENRGLAAKIVDSGGALMTEYPSSTPINSRYFPARNRIIAAMADAVVIVEASEKGGALITANIAMGYHRELFALPGRLSDKYSVGTNSLIATNKAALVRSADDIAMRLDWPANDSAPAQGRQQDLFPTLTDDEEHLLGLLRDHGQLSLDEAAALAALPMPKAAALAFSLEMKGAIRTLPGHLYQAAV